MNDIDVIISEIEAHHYEQPTHGIGCACMDKYIQELRKLTASKAAQQRIDYVLRKVLER